jgi:acyl-CoA dehydrogenase
VGTSRRCTWYAIPPLKLTITNIYASEDLYSKFAAKNFLIPNLPSPLPVKWLKKLGIHTLPGGLKVEEYDYLHTLIYVDEMSRTGSAGPSGAVTTGVAFGLPPILKFGSRELQERFVPDVITGRKRICIAITEPGAGSDVGNIATTATRTADGKHFIVNGTKKWYISSFLKIE